MPITRLASRGLLSLGLIGGSILLPATLLGILLHRYVSTPSIDTRDRRQAFVAFTVLGMVITGLLWWLGHPPGLFFWQTIEAFSRQSWTDSAISLVLFWLTTVPMAPLIALLIQMVILLRTNCLEAVLPDKTVDGSLTIAPITSHQGKAEREKRCERL